MVKYNPINHFYALISKYNLFYCERGFNWNSRKTKKIQNEIGMKIFVFVCLVNIIKHIRFITDNFRPPRSK